MHLDMYLYVSIYVRNNVPDNESIKIDTCLINCKYSSVHRLKVFKWVINCVVNRLINY